jgi:defect in organelle trafficking protein DotA
VRVCLLHVLVRYISVLLRFFFCHRIKLCCVMACPCIRFSISLLVLSDKTKKIGLLVTRVVQRRIIEEKGSMNLRGRRLLLIFCLLCFSVTAFAASFGDMLDEIKEAAQQQESSTGGFVDQLKDAVGDQQQESTTSTGVGWLDKLVEQQDSTTPSTGESGSFGGMLDEIKEAAQQQESSTGGFVDQLKDAVGDQQQESTTSTGVGWLDKLVEQQEQSTMSGWLNLPDMPDVSVDIPDLGDLIGGGGWSDLADAFADEEDAGISIASPTFVTTMPTSDTQDMSIMPIGGLSSDGTIAELPVQTSFTVTSSQAMSFTPPASDVSVIFLGNLFGLVDGVLHGSGSQIMGIIFNVFNSAILALGGIVMMYIILVSTMNTAHEGQMLGQKWSSIWVPVRATMGLALLIPKSSGYCLMQIFVMWVVVQGVGIADKVWGTALDYLNRGGVIMQAQIDPDTSLQAGVGIGGNNDNSVIGGASVILYGQVCMLALQTQLENERELDLEAKKVGSGPCSGTPSPQIMQDFCDNSVPDFVNSVDPLSAYNTNPGSASYSVAMPYFNTAPYNVLNGVCGTLNWTGFDVSSLTIPQNEEEEEEEVREQTQAEAISRAMQRSREKVKREGPLEARATVPGSPVGKVYAYFYDDAGSAIGGAVGSAGGAIGGAIGIGGDYGMPEMPWDSGRTGIVTGGHGGLEGGGMTLTTEGAEALDSYMTSAPESSGSSALTISSSDLEIIRKSRAAAIAQMYMTLASTARAIVSNDPEINPSGGDPNNFASPVADYQFGVPLTSGLGSCTIPGDDCPYWGKLDGSSAPILLDGTELQYAVTDYHAVMQPALKLLNDVKDKSKAESGRAFIQDAKRSGWILAGSYFFHLIQLNGSATATSNTVDSTSGLGKSSFKLDGVNGVCTGNHKYASLCYFFNGSDKKVNQIVALFTGLPVTSVSQKDLTRSGLTRIPNADIPSPAAASTVYGYANNAMLIDLPGQSGLKGPKLSFGLDELKVEISSEKLTAVKSGCNGFEIWGFEICIGQIFEDLFWDTTVVVVNLLLDALAEAGNFFINKMLIMPLDNFISVFEDAMAIITQPAINPVLALATMGVKYINVSMDTWMAVLIAGIAFSWLPVIYPIIMMVLPLFMVWIGLMVGIGYVTAYYIPFLPYMIFTFGALAWFIAVVEAMAAAPLVALGIAHPEGHDALGKSEQGLMILLNVFLRPAMMVIGFIASIAMCYVGVWLLNSGFSTLLGGIEDIGFWNQTEEWTLISTGIPWSKIFGFFFVILIYTMTYLTLVEKSFSLIAVLPDKVLRWIGGQQEGIGGEAMQWTSEAKGKVDKAGGEMDKASGAIQKGMTTAVMDVGKVAGKGADKAKGAMSGPSAESKPGG